MPLSFVNPWFLPFLALGALPLLIHLFARRRPRRVPVSSLNYIVPVVRHSQKMRRPRDILLLILRTLLILALVLLFTRPVLHTQMDAAGSDMSRVVLVIDRSLSMQCNEGGLTRFGSAQAAALQVLDLLPQTAQANVVWMASGCETPVDTLTDNVELLRREIESKAVSCELAAPQQALDKAAGLIGSQDGGPARGGRIYIISDFQVTNWKTVKLDRLPPEIQVLSIVAGRRETPNLSVSKVQVTPSSPAAGESFRVTAQVSNMGPSPVEQTALLELTSIVREEKISLAPYSQGSVSFDCVMKDHGTFPVKVSIPEDSLSADNTHYAVVTVSPAIGVGLCAFAADEGLKYLREAISASSSEKGIVQVTDLPANAPELLEGAGRKELDVVFLYGWDGRGQAGLTPARLARAIANSDATFVWMLPASPQKARSVDSSLFLQGGAAVSVGEWKTADPRKPLSLQIADPKSPLVEAFDEGRSGDLTASTFRGAYAINGKGAHTILAYSDGTLALASVDLMKQRCFLWNIPLGLEVTQFAGGNTFLPLVQELIRQNRTQKSPPSVVTGSGLSLPLPVDTEVSSVRVELARSEGPRDAGPRDAGPQGGRLKGDAGARKLPQDSAMVLIENDRLNVVLHKAAEPGIYRILDKTGLIHLVAANVPEVESDLRCLERADLQRTGSAAALVLGEESIRAVHKGLSLWPGLLAAAAVLFAAESLLLALWKVKET